MGMPAGELAQRMTYTEFVAHLADQQIEPWDELRGDLNAAQVVCTLANLHRQRGRRPYTVADCALRFEQASQPPQRPEEVVQHLERFFARYERNIPAQCGA